MSNLIFILFVFGGNTGVAFQEFDSQLACERARIEINSISNNWRGIETRCLRKS